MKESDFWKFIEAVHRIPSEITEDSDKATLQNNLLKSALKGSEPDRIAAFQKIMAEKLRQLYIPKIAELFLVISNGKNNTVTYLSTDGFLDFRAWIIGLGHSHFNTFLHFTTEEELIPFNLQPNYTHRGNLPFLALEVYKELTGKNLCPDASEFDGEIQDLNNAIEWNNLSMKYSLLIERCNK